MRIALLANVKENAPQSDGGVPDRWDDLDGLDTIESIVGALENGGHEAAFFEASFQPEYDLVGHLTRYNPDLCFNIAEGHFGDGREAHVPSILEMLRLPYTGSRVLTMALALDKPMTKRILTYHDLPTPDFQVFGQPGDSINTDLLTEQGELRSAMIVKPSREGTGIGVSAESIVKDVAGLQQQVRRQLLSYNQPILCEQFIEGRDITVGILGNLGATAARRLNDRTAPDLLPQELTFFPPLEVDKSAYDSSEAGLYTNRIKVELAHEFFYLCPAPLREDEVDNLNRLAAAVFRVMDCHDVARIDFRLDEEHGDKPYILEINPLPGLCPDYSDLPISAYAAGWNYDRLINGIVEAAVKRQQVVGGKD